MELNTFDRAMRARFGKKTYRLALDYGFGCPNRDGTVGTGGCIFCSAQGAGNFAGKGETFAEKTDAAKARIRSKAGADCAYIAYFQSYCNTYAPVSVLEPLFTEAIRREDIAALSIATRPDCLPPDVLALLARLAKEKPVWVELGLQTANEQTARRINRCYPLSVYDEAVAALHKNGIEVVAHMIIGLPGETTDDAIQTAKHIAETGAQGVKLHLLHVLRGTPMETLWRTGAYVPLTLPQYADALCRVLPHIPRETVIHRYTGDGDKRELLAPMWSADKKRVLNELNRVFLARDVRQGSLCGTD